MRGPAFVWTSTGVYGNPAGGHAAPVRYARIEACPATSTQPLATDGAAGELVAVELPATRFSPTNPGTVTSTSSGRLIATTSAYNHRRPRMPTFSSLDQPDWSCGARRWEFTGSVFPMEVTVDDVGRIVLPKPLRDRLQLTPGTKVDVSEYGDGLHVAPVSRTARLERRDGYLVAVSDTAIDDDDVLGLIDAGRR
jgi:AbrB family looped-hinge helix DNA binding protein